MGKDFTPQELHACDRLYSFSSVPLVLTDTKTGDQIDLYDPGSEETARWPNTNFLFSDIIKARRYPDDILDLFEKTLTSIITCDDKDIPFVPQDSFQQDMYAWYLGKLDPGFYYSETNNRIMDESVAAEYKRRKEKENGCK